MARLHELTLFRASTLGYHTYRIPSLLRTPTGALVALCEGRRDNSSDTGKIDILMRMSWDSGETWSDQRVIWSDGDNTCGNPCPVADVLTGAVHLLLTHNLGSDTEREIIDRTAAGTRTVWLSTSHDDGQSWSPPSDITASTKPDTWTWYATGPGAGIQTTSGRLVIPCDHIEGNSRRYYSHVILSDDHGASWRLGGSTPQDEVNECEVVELSDSTLHLNMRNYVRGDNCRAVSLSPDGGETWSDVTRDRALPEPRCQASIRKVGGGIVFSNPAHTSERRNMTVRLSGDGARTWSASRVLHPGPSAYSCLAEIGDGLVGCLYERGENGQTPYQEIRLAVFDPAWLNGGDEPN